MKHPPATEQPNELAGHRFVNTTAAAAQLGRRPKTLHNWSSDGDGPLKPLRINGRLAWPVDELQKLTSGQTLGEGA